LRRLPVSQSLLCVVWASPSCAVARSAFLGVAILISRVSPRGTCADPWRRRAADVVGLAGQRGRPGYDGHPLPHGPAPPLSLYIARARNLFAVKTRGYVSR